jgi:hypothetical protein
MYELLKSNDGQILFKKLPTKMASDVKEKEMQPHKYIFHKPGITSFNKWVVDHEDFLNWIYDIYTNQVLSVNENVCKVFIDHTKLRRTIAECMYNTSYNKEKAYAALV